jgi:hypothetical protein
MEAIPDKPKGMHDRTYNRLRRDHDEAEARSRLRTWTGEPTCFFHCQKTEQLYRFAVVTWRASLPFDAMM